MVHDAMDRGRRYDTFVLAWGPCHGPCAKEGGNAAARRVDERIVIKRPAQGRTYWNTPNKKNARAHRAGQWSHRSEQRSPNTFQKAQTPNFLDHYWSRCGVARFVFGRLLYFG